MGDPQEAVGGVSQRRQTPWVTTPSFPPGYPDWLAALKLRIRAARLKAAVAVNAELITLYWSIGRDILERQSNQGWGARIVSRLADDLRREFPGTAGFSRANLLYMRAFAEAWPDPQTVQQLVGRLPWGQNIELLAVKDCRRARAPGPGGD